jgi:hypothetical protein
MNPSVCPHEGKDHIYKGFLQAGGAIDFRCLTDDFFTGPNPVEIPDSGAAKMSHTFEIGIARVQIRPSQGGEVDSK